MSKKLRRKHTADRDRRESITPFDSSCKCEERLRVYIEQWCVYKLEDGTIHKVIRDRKTNHLYDICKKCGKMIIENAV